MNEHQHALTHGGWLPTLMTGVASGVLTALAGLGGPPAVYSLAHITRVRLCAQSCSAISRYCSAERRFCLSRITAFEGRNSALLWFLFPCLRQA